MSIGSVSIASSSASSLKNAARRAACAEEQNIQGTHIIVIIYLE